MNEKEKKFQFYSWHEIKSTEITEQLVELPFHHRIHFPPINFFILWWDEALIYQKFRTALRIPQPFQNILSHPHIKAHSLNSHANIHHTVALILINFSYHFSYCAASHFTFTTALSKFYFHFWLCSLLSCAYMPSDSLLGCAKFVTNFFYFMLML